MLLPAGTNVADGGRPVVLRDTGGDTALKLTAQPTPAVGGDDKSGGAHHGSSAANPDDSRLEEDSAAAAAGWLSREVQAGRIADLVVVAPANTLGELRRPYHETLEARLVGELSEDLVDAPIPEIEQILQVA